MQTVSLTPKETICKKYQSLLSGKQNKKNISNCSLLIFSPRVWLLFYAEYGVIALVPYGNSNDLSRPVSVSKQYGQDFHSLLI